MKNTPMLANETIGLSLKPLIKPMYDMYDEIQKGKVYIVIGGQYGSEAKGLFTAHLTIEKNINYAVRTGSINAGHTVYYNGVAHKNQQIPVGWVNPNTKLVIGAGAYVSPETLHKEIEDIEKTTKQSLKGKLFIDCRCGAHLPIHVEKETGMHERMGSTGEGCSEAIKDKMSRKFDYVFFKDTDFAQKNDGKHFQIVDTVKILNDAYDEKQSILLEGTQGTLLDLHLSYFPFCTSRQTVAANWLAEAGLSPNMNLEIAMVVRTFPIRVAGNSGPMPKEILWEDLAQRMNGKLVEYGKRPLVMEESLRLFKQEINRVALGMGLPSINFNEWTTEERQKYSTELVNIHKLALSKLPNAVFEDLKNLFELTTVTKKLRRISELGIDELKYAISINRPDYLVLNFLNYKFPTLYNVQKLIDSPEFEEIEKYIEDLEEKTQTKVAYVNWQKDRIHAYNK